MANSTRRKGSSKENQKPNSFGELLLYYRTVVAGLTQLQLGMRLQQVGYPIGASFTSLSMWENNHRLPSDPTVFHFLSLAMGLTKEQEEALLHACLAEMQMNYLKDYLALKAQWEMQDPQGD